MTIRPLLRIPALLTALAASAVTGALVSCESVDDDRIPYAEVRLTFLTVGDWNIHGVKGDAADSKRYIFTSSERIPADFPYTALDRTGFGGLLLATDVLGELYVYDLACPVEARPTVRIEVAPGATEARCPQFGSTFDIYGATHGNPLTGPAADRGYALRRYHVHSGGPTEYRVITR